MSQPDAQKVAAKEKEMAAKDAKFKEAMAANDSVKAQPTDKSKTDTASAALAQPTDKNKTASSALAQPVGQQNTPGNNNYDFGMSVAIAGQTFQASVLKSSQIIESTFGKFGSP